MWSTSSTRCSGPDVKRPGKIALAALLALYPPAVYWGLQYLEPRVFGGLLILLLAARALVARSELSVIPRSQWYPLVFMGCACALAAMIFNSADSLRLLPVATNAVCLASFAWTLRYPPSMIERFARALEGALDERGMVYTRRVTQVWCVFFAINGAIALYTSMAASLAIWTLYNGLIAYLLMALLFAGEFLVRRRARAAVR